MPIYEYRCDDCSDTFEVLTSFSQRDSERSCPECESTHTHVLVSSFAAFSGAGEQGASASLGGGGCGPGCCGGACHAN
jgi:putative FmdB family regulatory protein